MLSNNDGCVVARSKEAKALGIKAGTPYYQVAEQIPKGVLTVFSSNYELYGDITNRVMNIIRDASPSFYRYSIDEAFCILDGMNINDLKKWGEDLSKKILKWTGMPVSVGIASTKTLAKCADRFAKDYPAYNKCCIIDNEEKRVKALQIFPIKEVWGIGRQLNARLESIGINYAYDFSMKPRHWIREMFHITGERTWMELNGTDCIPTEDMTTKKSICTSRSFPGMIEDFTKIRTYVSNYAARCSEKLRKQNSVCSMITVFISTNTMRKDLPQYSNSINYSFLTPCNTTQQCVAAALECLKQIFREGYKYKRAGVIVTGISSANSIQTSFIDYDAIKQNKMQRLSQVADDINSKNGSETIVLGSQQFTAEKGQGKAGIFRDAIKHEFRSGNYTTRWNDIIIVK